MTLYILNRNLVAHTDQVQSALDLVHDSKVPAMLEMWRASDRERSGRTGKGGMAPWLRDDKMLAVLHLVTNAGYPQTVDTMAGLVYHGLNAESRVLLGVDPAGLTERQVRGRVDRSFHSVLSVVDPHPGTKKQTKTVTELEDYVRTLDSVVTEERQGRLLELSNGLLAASFRFLPEEYRDRWNGNCAVDATFIPAHSSRGNASSKGDGDRLASSEPFGGYYVRANGRETHGLTSEELKGMTRGKWTGFAKTGWGWEATTVVMGSNDPTREATFPLLVVGMSFHKPACAPGPRALDALRAMGAADMPAGFLAGDRAYGYKPEPKDFSGVARQLGYKMVWDVTKPDLGKTRTVNGAVVLEGNLYCPSILKNGRLLNAVKEYRYPPSKTRGADSFADYDASIELRSTLMLKAHGRMEEGGCARFRCPASGPSPTVSCPLRPRDDGKVGLAKVPADHIPSANIRGRFCTSTSGVATMKPDQVFPRHVQDLQFGSKEWYDTYSVLRQGVESFNFQVKDGAFTGLASQDRRRVRGNAAQNLFTAMVLVAANLRKVDRWLANPVQVDASGRGPLKNVTKKRRRDELRPGPRWYHNLPAIAVEGQMSKAA